jgi:hypothetical protein
LPEIVEAQGGHGTLPNEMGRRPSSEAAPAVAARQARQNGLSAS